MSATKTRRAAIIGVKYKEALMKNKITIDLTKEESESIIFAINSHIDHINKTIDEFRQTGIPLFLSEEKMEYTMLRNKIATLYNK